MIQSKDESEAWRLYQRQEFVYTLLSLPRFMGDDTRNDSV